MSFDATGEDERQKLLLDRLLSGLILLTMPTFALSTLLVN